MMLQLVLFFVFLSTINGDDCPHTILTNDGDILAFICDNNCNSCIISCNGNDACKGSDIYSGAFRTNITCNGISACEKGNVYIGYLRDVSYPNGYNLEMFQEKEYSDFEINCQTEKSCNEMNLNVYGNFVNGGMVDVTGNGDDRLLGGSLLIDLEKGVYSAYVL